MKSLRAHGRPLIMRQKGQLMAKVIMFMQNELYTENKELNEAFRKKVSDFVKYLVENPNFKEYQEPALDEQYERIFTSNPDCEVVFTTENATEPQWQASKREILTFEWRNHSNDSKVLPVKVERTDDFGIRSYVTRHYGLRYHT